MSVLIFIRLTHHNWFLINFGILVNQKWPGCKTQPPKTCLYLLVDQLLWPNDLRLKIYSKTYSTLSWDLRPTACNFIKKETLTQVFSCEICKIFKNTFFTEHLRMTASVLTLFRMDIFGAAHGWPPPPA